MFLKKKAGLTDIDIGSHKVDAEHKKKLQDFDKMRLRYGRFIARRKRVTNWNIG